MKRNILVYRRGRNPMRFTTPRLTLGGIVHYVAHALRNDRDRPFAVDVIVNGECIEPTEINRRKNPALSAEIVLTQYVGHGSTSIPNEAWVLT